MNVFDDSKHLMRAFEQTVDVVNHEQADLYMGLVEEEWDKELRDAVFAYFMSGPKPEILTEVCDAIIDSVVVLLGLGHSLGLPLQAAWEEVLRSNLSKLHEGRLVRRADGKVLKGPGFSPPNLLPLIEAARINEPRQ